MTAAVQIFYVSIPTESADQTRSLSEYLTQHGLAAFEDGTDSVTVPMEDLSRATELEHTCAGWRRYWDNSCAELYGLPLYTKV